MSWYGGAEVHTALNKAVEQYQGENSGVTIATQYSEFADYWDKQATQVAGGNAPDLWRHSMNYLLEYADRGALLDLSPFVGEQINVSGLDPSMMETGRVGGELLAIGNNSISQALFYNTAALESAGVEMPDHTWTWDEFADLTAEISRGGNGGGDAFYGTSDAGGSMAMLDVFVSQRGGRLYSEGGDLGFARNDLSEWYGFWNDLRESGVAPPSDVTAAITGFETDPMVEGRAAMTFGVSQQIIFYQALVQDELEYNMVPNGPSGSPPGQSLGPLDYWVISSRTEYPEETARVVDFLLNDPRAIRDIGLTFGGLPSDKARRIVEADPNTAVDQKVFDYLNLIRDKTKPREIPYAAGHGEVEAFLDQVNEQIGFGELSVGAGVDRFFEEAERILG